MKEGGRRAGRERDVSTEAQSEQCDARLSQPLWVLKMERLGITMSRGLWVASRSQKREGNILPQMF